MVTWLGWGSIVLLAAAGCGGCGDDDGTPGDAGPDAADAEMIIGFDANVDSGPPDPMMPSVEIGTGSRGFVAFEDGDTLLLARGCQGGQHVWISLRIRNLMPRSAIVQLQMLRIPDGMTVGCRDGHPEDCRPLETCTASRCMNSYPFQVRTTFIEDPTGDFAEVSGLTLQTPDPDGLLDTDVSIRARVVDRSDPPREAVAERRVRVEWGTETCGSMRDADVPDGGDAGLIPMGLDAGG